MSDDKQKPAEAMIDMMSEMSEAFDKLCQERHEAGAAEYGQFTFLGNDVVRMMAEELADTSNYCRMQFVKLMLLQQLLEQEVGAKAGEGTQEVTIGIKSFKGTGETGWGK